MIDTINGKVVTDTKRLGEVLANLTSPESVEITGWHYDTNEYLIFKNIKLRTEEVKSKESSADSTTAKKQTAEQDFKIIKLKREIEELERERQSLETLIKNERIPSLSNQIRLTQVRTDINLKRIELLRIK